MTYGVESRQRPGDRSQRRDGDAREFPFTLKGKKGHGPAPTLQPKFRDYFSVFMLAAVVVIILLIVGGQTLIWANTGHWPGISVGDVIALALPTAPIGIWVAKPQTWLGLHQIVTETPLVMFIIIVWGLIAWLMD